MASFQRHLFLCVNDRGEGHPRGSCAHKGASEVAAAFKKGAFERGLKRVIRVNKSGCLDQCEAGVCAVVYPEGVWYGSVTPNDVPEILEEHIIGGRPVDRLRLRPEQLTGREPKPGEIQPFRDSEETR